MITVYFNHQSLSIPKNTSLYDLLHTQGWSNTLFALAINKEFIPKKSYQHIILKNDDIIDILTPMQGG